MEDWAPTVEHVHAHIATRNQGRPWNDESSPTRAEVGLLIEGAISEVIGEAGVLPDRTDANAYLHGLATLAASLRTAERVEMTAYPEQADNQADMLFRQWRATIELLKSKLGGGRTGGARTIRMGSAFLRSPVGSYDAERRSW